MDPFLSLTTTAARMTLPPGANPTTTKNRILRMAQEIDVSVTIRRVAGGLLFWRSTDEDLKQAKEIAQRLQTARRTRRARPGRGRQA